MNKDENYSLKLCVFAKPDDWQAFRDQILQLLEYKDQHKEMSQLCREIAIKEDSIELQVQKYKEVYQQLT